MGLDAYVFCDCFEKGRLLANAPPGLTLVVEPDGYVGHQGSLGSLESELAWDQWRENLACEHTGGVLMHQRLGNIALIGMLRSELQGEASRFPILLGKVLYSGSHTGDFLAVNVVPSLKAEIEALAGFKCSKRMAQELMAQFRNQMSGLISASTSVNKPIAF
jgi:hypothetical protein